MAIAERLSVLAARLAAGGPALALVLVLFGLSNGLAGDRFGDWQPNRWWIDLGSVGLPGWMVMVYLLMLLPWSLGLMAGHAAGRDEVGVSGGKRGGEGLSHSPGRRRRLWRLVDCAGEVVRCVGRVLGRAGEARFFRVLAGVGVLGLSVGVLANTAEVVRLWQRGVIEIGSGLIFSVLVLVWLGWIGLGLLVSPTARGSRGAFVFRWWPTVGACLLLLVGFPLGQAVSLGKTDYRRPAAFAVVLGARAYADGRVSDALYDRVMTGVELYHAGLVEALVFSGGPIAGVDPQNGVRNRFGNSDRVVPESGNDGSSQSRNVETVPDTFLGVRGRGLGAGVMSAGDRAMDEPLAMRRLAMEHGVPDEAIILDHGGWNTRLTANRVTKMAKALGLGDYQMVAVSHDFHLPRIRVAFEQAGIRVLTVPARERYMLSQKPMLFAREVAAFWAYWWGRRES